MDSSEFIEIKNTERGQSLYAKKDLEMEQPILAFERNFIEKRTRMSIQIDENKHQECTNPNSFENFLNHSCNPNAYINFENLSLKALKKIKTGEEITVNFNTFEWEIIEGFTCHCLNLNCYDKVKGFKYLDENQRKEIEYLLSPYLKKKINDY